MEKQVEVKYKCTKCRNGWIVGRQGRIMNIETVCHVCNGKKYVDYDTAIAYNIPTTKKNQFKKSS